MDQVKLLLPKGRIYDNVIRLFAESGISIGATNRSYFPSVSDPSLSVKIMKPQNIAPILDLGRHDAGFTGLDWVMERSADIVEIMDLALDPVSIVLAAPMGETMESLKKRKIVVATEYEKLARDFLSANGFDFTILKSFGTTEVFPPDDADAIVDNTSSGTTLRENGLDIVATILKSSTRFVASRKAMADPGKAERLAELATVFKAILEAEGRVMLEMNVPKDRLDAVVAVLPCMRAPTVSPLFHDSGYAVKAAVPKKQTGILIPKLKKLGASDILEYAIRKVVI
jgi:ATP phosphoribosyltransferase